MGHYLLSTYSIAGEVAGAPHTPEEIQAFMRRVIALEADMDAAGAFVFGGALRSPEEASVVPPPGSGAMATDGPFLKTEENVAGFYIVEADDLDSARAWADRVAEATGHPIEIRPFFATGRVADQMPDLPA